jgi:hypothetical protein
MSGLKWLLVLAAVAAAVWWFTRDPVEVAYQKCLAQVEEQMTGGAPAGNAAEQALSDAMKGMGSALGNAVCDSMRAACKEDRDSAICKAALAQF